jgi:hypothetical protein
VYVVSDVHGYRADLLTLLRRGGLVDKTGDWIGGPAHLWGLGDYVDRGPDGIGVLNELMRLSVQASLAGGSVHILLGNHELMLLGGHRFGAEQVPEWGDHSFAGVWLRNGGLLSDQNRITAAHVEWLTNAGVVALVNDHLLMHADTGGYLRYGKSIDEINNNTREILREGDLTAWWDCFRTLTERGAFRRTSGDTNDIDKLLATLGGHTIVHGHSTIPEAFNMDPRKVDGGVRYADGRVLDVDGGRYLGGRLLLIELPAPPLSGPVAVASEAVAS